MQGRFLCGRVRSRTDRGGVSAVVGGLAVFVIVGPVLLDAYQRSAQTVGESGWDRRAVFFSHSEAYFRHDDADARSGPMYDLETARTMSPPLLAA